MINDGPEAVSIKETIGEFLFGAFYISLFFLQILPHIAIMAMEPSVLYYTMVVVGIAAGIVQNIKFPCFAIRTFSTGMIVATIVLAFFPIR